MHCSNCGKDIPFTGRVCPYCHVDKSSDQAVMALGIVGAVVGASIGYLVGDVAGAIAGFFCGMFALMIVAVATKPAKSKKARRVKTLPNMAATLQQAEGRRARSTNSPSPSASPRDEVPCHYCAEAILRKAKKCKHCGSSQPALCPECSGVLEVSPDGKRAKCTACQKVLTNKV